MSRPLEGTKSRRRLFLMRHGEVRYFGADGRPVNAHKVELTGAGRGQAQAVGALLAEVPLDLALHSGLPRTRQTAELVLAARDLEPEADGDFREIVSGRFRDIPRDEAEEAFLNGMARAHEPGARFAGGEVFAAFYARVTGALERLILERAWTTALLVAHEGTNRMLLGWASGAGLAAAGGFEQDPGCLNILDVDVADGAIARRHIKAMNLTPNNFAKHGNHLTSMEQVFLARSQATAP